jgi:hypothetical protein
MRRRRPIRKNMAQMAAAAAAMHLGAYHAMAPIPALLDGAFAGIVKTRPASAAIEFFARHEKALSAAGAHEGAGAFFMVEGAAARRLRAMRAHHSILFRREKAPPFFICMGYVKRLALHGHSLPDRPLQSKKPISMRYTGLMVDTAAFDLSSATRSLIAFRLRFMNFPSSTKVVELLTASQIWLCQAGASCISAIEVHSLSTTIERVVFGNKSPLSAAAFASRKLSNSLLSLLLLIWIGVPHAIFALSYAS